MCNLPRGIRSQSKNSTTDSSVPHLCTRYFFLLLHCSGKRRYLYSFQRLGSSSVSEFPKCKIKVNAQRQNFWEDTMSYLSHAILQRHMYTRECQISGITGFEVGHQLNTVLILRTLNKRGEHGSWLGIYPFIFRNWWVGVIQRHSSSTAKTIKSAIQHQKHCQPAFTPQHRSNPKS